MTMEVDLGTRQAILDVVTRYATGIDERDWTLFLSCFTDDCIADYGEIGYWEGGDAVTQFMKRVHADCGHTMHWIGNHVLRANADRFEARTYVCALVLHGDNRKGLQHYGYYDDRFVLTDTGWKISTRTFTPTLTMRVVAYPE
jgi:3-phenylpropionate/cinnamic acid dioxygenase small subunit